MGLFSRGKEIRSTLEAETLRNVFKEDYELYLKIGASEDLKRYLELEKYVNSAVFKENKKRIDRLTYKGSSYYEAERHFKKLIKDKKLRAFYVIRDSKELQGYLKIKESEEYHEFKRLQALVKSSGFDKKLRVEEFLRYKTLLFEEKIKAAVRLEKNRQYRSYLEIKGTDTPEEFEKLNVYIKSDEFKKNRDYLLNKKRYETTDDYKLKCEYDELHHRHDLVKYFALNEDVNFKNLVKWDIVFSEDFRDGSIDLKKWTTKYYAGERFLRDTYGTGKDVQLFTPDNIEFENNAVRLRFKKESITGKYWDTRLGITEHNYSYTSGMLSTAPSFRQKYGRFEAKIKLSRSAVKQCFWMKGDEELPHVLIMENSASGLSVGNIFRHKTNIVNAMFRLKEVKLSNEYYIFSFEWTKNKMVWKINDTVIKEISENIPDTPMYIGFSLGATGVSSDKFPSSTMDIDWVRCFQLKEKE